LGDVRVMMRPSSVDPTPWFSRRELDLDTERSGGRSTGRATPTDRWLTCSKLTERVNGTPKFYVNGERSTGVPARRVERTRYGLDRGRRRRLAIAHQDFLARHWFRADRSPAGSPERIGHAVCQHAHEDCSGQLHHIQEAGAPAVSASDPPETPRRRPVRHAETRAAALARSKAWSDSGTKPEGSHRTRWRG